MLEKVRRILFIVLAGAMLFMLVSCGKNHERDLTDVITSVSWEMTKSGVKDLAGNPDKVEDTYFAYEGEYLGYAGEYIYGFDDDNKLRFIKFIFNDEDVASELINTFKNRYGDPDKIIDSGVQAYWWYGNVAGEDSLLALDISANLVEVDKEE